MSKLFERIREEAAKSLQLPSGRRPVEELPRYKRFLHKCRLLTRYFHNQGASGREIVQARTLAVDLLFTFALRAAEALSGSTRKGRVVPYAIVALGGYGRQELSPNSDIDVQFLHATTNLKQPPRPAFMELMEESWIYNVFPKVQVLVRTPEESVAAGNRDLRSKTSLIEARLVCGNARLFQRMQRRVVSGCVRRRENAYVEQRLADQEERRRRFGDTPFLQEPNLKNGCGGLRDYQNLLWMTFFRYRAATTAELQARKLITPRERAALDAAYEYLLRVRNDLHFRNERSNDVLLKAVQPAVARAMNFQDGSPRRRLERLMHAYYGHVRQVHEITRNVEERLALVPQPGRLPRLADFLRARRRRAAYEVDGFKFVDGAVIPASERVFQDKPSRLMLAFFNAQARGLRLHPELLQLIRDQTGLVTPAFRRDRNICQMFLEMLKHQGRVAPILRQMHACGLLGAFLLPFKRLTGQVQHEFFHQFTADEHTLVCLQKLDEIWTGKTPQLRPYAEMFRRIERPELLYLTVLLHDTGKGEGRDHAESGARISATVSRQLQLDADSAGRVQRLVRHHLAMVVTSQKRNLGDPHVIQAFADLVGDLENLRALTLLTLADSFGTSDKLWSSFKDALLLTLYHRTHEHLQGVSAVAEDAERARLLEAIASRRPPELAPDEIEAHFSNLPGSCFLHASADKVLADLRLAHEFLLAQVEGSADPFEPRIHWEHLADQGCSIVRCCTWDRQGLFARLAGALTAASLNILSADIYTRSDGFVIDTFWVADPVTATPAGPKAMVRFDRLAREALTGRLDLAECLRQPGASQRPVYEAPGGERLRTTVHFDNHAGRAQTILEIEAEDRLGLLYTIATVLSGLRVNISLARINTSNGAASDAFYVAEEDGSPIHSMTRQKQIRTALVSALRA